MAKHPKPKPSVRGRRSRVNVPARLLHSRKQVAELLGDVSISTIQRLEAEGRLKPIRLTKKPFAQVFFTHEQVVALVKELISAS